MKIMSLLSTFCQTFHLEKLTKKSQIFLKSMMSYKFFPPNEFFTKPEADLFKWEKAGNLRHVDEKHKKILVIIFIVIKCLIQVVLSKPHIYKPKLDRFAEHRL